MEIDQIYVMSQVFTVLMYAFLGITYQVKSRRKLQLSIDFLRCSALQ